MYIRIYSTFPPFCRRHVPSEEEYNNHFLFSLGVYRSNYIILYIIIFYEHYSSAGSIDAFACSYLEAFAVVLSLVLLAVVAAALLIGCISCIQRCNCRKRCRSRKMTATVKGMQQLQLLTYRISACMQVVGLRHAVLHCCIEQICTWACV